MAVGNNSPGPTADLFWNWVEIGTQEECWEWKRSCNPLGYGRAWLKGKSWLAHRIAYTLAKGEIPAGYSVLHSCDNPPCCNPAHLSAGTHSENMGDMKAKGRAKGFPAEQNPRARLTWDMVRELRARSEAGESGNSLAKVYGISQTHASLIIRNQSWRAA